MSPALGFVAGICVGIVVASGTARCETRIIDGDTIQHRGERIRLWGLDCPETSTRDGRIAAEALGRLLAGNRVIITDRQPARSYNRTVARVLVQRISRAEFFTFDAACWMIQQGYCTEMTRYSNNFYRSCKP